MGAAAPCCKNDQDFSETKPESTSVGKERPVAAPAVEQEEAAPLAKAYAPSAAAAPKPVDQSSPQGENGQAAKKKDVVDPSEVEVSVANQDPAKSGDESEAAAEPEQVEEKMLAKRSEGKKPTVQPMRPNDDVQMQFGKIKEFYTVHFPAIAEGAYGEVYKAETKDTKQARAVKRIPFSNVDSPEEFEKEFAMAKRLKHPNLGYLHDTITDQEGKFWYLVTDLFSGGDLFDVLTDRGQRPSSIKESILARYATEMLEGIKYCHFHSYCHRDIKCENYMLEYYGDAAPLKLIDFGAACTFTPGTPMTQTVGTLAHAAPELLKGSYDEKIDIWSIGITLYFLSVAKQPFTDPEEDEDRLKTYIMNGPNLEQMIKDDRSLWQCVSEDSSDNTNALDIIRQMLVIDATQRPTARMLLKSNDKYLAKAEKAKPRNVVEAKSGGGGCCSIQ